MLAEGVPAFGTASFEVLFDPAANSSTTVLPTVVSGAAAVAAAGGLGYDDDPHCTRVHFDPSDGIMSGWDTCEPAAATTAAADSDSDSDSDSNSDAVNVSIRARQAYWQYLDGPGGPCVFVFCCL